MGIYRQALEAFRAGVQPLLSREAATVRLTIGDGVTLEMLDLPETFRARAIAPPQSRLVRATEITVELGPAPATGAGGRITEIWRRLRTCLAAVAALAAGGAPAGDERL